MSDAIVIVQDDRGIPYEFEEQTPGVYLAKAAFAGEVGRNYQLSVSVGDQQFTASETLPPIVAIDSIVYAISFFQVSGLVAAEVVIE